MIDIQKLQYDEFEMLVGLLLKREGHQIVHGPGAPGTRGPDYETISPDGHPVVVEVKHFTRGSVGKSSVLQFAGDLERYRQQQMAAKGLLVVSSPLSERTTAALSEIPDIVVWDHESVSSRLVHHKDLEMVLAAAIDSRGTFQAKVANLMEGSANRADALSFQLRALPCGHNDWRAYEKICTEILTFVFTPNLAAPDIQSRSEDGLDIIDAIFPIRSNLPPWSLVRSEYGTRFAVAEFKNYCRPIGQSQVEAITQYLWRPAQRFFGLLVSRTAPGPSAIAQRRRKWLDEEKCIVFLSDDELCEMLQLRTAEEEPFDIIDAQLEDFFRTLTP